ncbi:MAG: MarR family transcriptional regulator [Desulfobacteraceae bacterium]
MEDSRDNALNTLVGSIQELVRVAYIHPHAKSQKYDLTLSQSGVVRNLMISGPLSSAELSRKLYVTPSNITGVIDRLEKKGLVERIRAKEDRRVNLISLTEKGKEIGRSLPDPFEKKIRHNFTKLNPEEVNYLTQAVEQITGLMKEY